MTTTRAPHAGISLADLIRRAAIVEPLPIQICLDIARQLADRIDTHGHGPRASTMGYRFLTPEAIVIGLDGTVQIAGFGVAPTAEQLATSDPSVVEHAVAYMAPEQLRGDAADHRAELFGIGTILYELLTGRRLYAGALEDSRTRILEEPPPDVGEERTDCPSDLVELLFELLCKDPEARPPSAAEVSRRLARQVEERILWEGRLDLASFVAPVVGDLEPREPVASSDTPGSSSIDERPAASPAPSLVRDVVVVALLLGLSAALGWIARLIVS